MPTSDPPKLLPWLGGQLPGNQSLWVPGEVWLQSWNLKELTEGHHQEWSLRLNLTQHGETHPARTQWGLTDWEFFLDSVGGGAWPFLVAVAFCCAAWKYLNDLNWQQDFRNHSPSFFPLILVGVTTARAGTLPKAGQSNCVLLKKRK